MSYSFIEKGQSNSLDYRIFFKSPEGNIISPFHDIPLFHDEEKGILNMVVEIPRWSNAKMEICTTEKFNPIKQDVKKGKLRFVKNVFPHHGYIWNYGALPQTWEDPNHLDENTNAKGDKDPLDVCEIGHKVHKRGTVIQVKALGVMCLIDEGETDWKIIVIDVTDPLASELNDIGDVEKKLPGFIKATHEWFTIYKIPDGKPPNNFAFSGEAKDRAFAMKVIKDTHGQWKKLMAKNVDSCGLSCENSCVKDSPYSVGADDANKHVDAAQPFVPGTELDSSVDQWHYVKL